MNKKKWAWHRKFMWHFDKAPGYQLGNIPHISVYVLLGPKLLLHWKTSMSPYENWNHTAEHCNMYKYWSSCHTHDIICPVST